jgi:hypothetical protein
MLKNFLFAIFLLCVLSACASLPENRQEGIKTDQVLTMQKDERNASMESFIDFEALRRVQSVSLPSVSVAEGIVSDKITQAQADLVANRAGRELCRELTDYFEFREEQDNPDLRLQVVITAISPTSSGASGVSALLGVFVPGPFRLPAGMGGLAADGGAADESGRKILITRWAKGANAFVNDAKVSSIGDAYQLANSFGEAFAKLLIHSSTDDKNKRAVIDKEKSTKNQLLCDTRFGKASVAGRGASILLPLSPEAIDSGAPKDMNEDATLQQK